MITTETRTPHLKSGSHFTPHTYGNGEPYRPPRSSILPSPYIGNTTLTPCIAVPGPQLDWADLWAAVQDQLRNARFAASTLLLYRRVLRSFRDFATRHPHPALRAERPCDVHRALVEDFIHHVNRNRCSWSWLSSNTAVLRTVFDKLAGFNVTARLRTPKRPWRLPDIISAADATRLIEAADTIRDRLIIGIFYGCGLKPGELCALRWKDVDVNRRTITVRFARNTRTREIPIPNAIFDILELGTWKCQPEDHVFPGETPGKPLTVRVIERMVSRTAEAAGIGKAVTCMILRHSYAADCLRHGMRVNQLKEYLGHGSIETTLDYQRLILPDDFLSPVDSLQSPPQNPDASPHESSALDSPAMRHALCSLPSSFPFPAIPSGPRAFINMLKTQIRGRFLALRRFVTNTS